MQSHPVTATLITSMLASALLAQPPGAGRPPADSNILPFRAVETTLANGLKLIVVPTGFANLVSVQIVVQAGSRNEVEPGKSGFAHFFEHLMFRGTPKNPPERYQAIMRKAGARDNAGTGDDFTRYYSTFAKDDLDTVLGLYADMFQNLAYGEADFKTEARAILGEYNKNSAEPLLKLYETQRDRFYQAHSYKHTTMGFIKDIENMPNEYGYSKLFFDRWYRPQYTTVIVAGDVSPEEVQSLMEKHWGGWKRGTAVAPAIPMEPPPAGPKYAHVPWPTETLPWVTVGFLAPAFDAHSTDFAAIALLSAHYFGPTSDLYKKLVVTEQKADVLRIDVPSNIDPSLVTVLARLKNAADGVDVRNEILATFAQARASQVPVDRLAAAKSFNRYSFARSIDSSERVTAAVGEFAAHTRSYRTANDYYNTLDSLTPANLQQTAAKYFVDQALIVTTLSSDSLPAGIERAPTLSSLEARATTSASTQSNPSRKSVETSTETNHDHGATTVASTGGAGLPFVIQKSQLPQLNIKLLFAVGSAHDPAGKEGLAALTAAMMSRAGSTTMTIDEIDAALYPTAGSFVGRTDKEVTSFTGSIHRDRWQTLNDIAFPQLLSQGWRQGDFDRLKMRQLNALVQDLRSNNEEELGKERLQTNIFRGTPYGHVTLGTVAGLRVITLDDVRGFARQMYTRANLTVGLSGDVPDEMVRDLQARLHTLPDGPAADRVKVEATRRPGIEVEILEKDTRATAMSFGFPIEVTRAHPDFAALSVARAWLGEHRMSSGRLYQQIREVRGINYGDYAYIEAFPRGMFQFFPDPNVARSRQIFEIWIRPVVPVNAHMTLRIAVHELAQLVRNGLTKEEFEATRDYLMKNVYVMTARQDQQLGYALDSRWYGIGEFTEYMRTALRSLTVDHVNAAIKRHLPTENMSIVIVTKDAAALKQALASDAFSPIRYDGGKPQALLDEDQVIGKLALKIKASDVTITPITDVFAR
jgi:zinc protease